MAFTGFLVWFPLFGLALLFILVSSVSACQFVNKELTQSPGFCTLSKSNVRAWEKFSRLCL